MGTEPGGGIEDQPAGKITTKFIGPWTYQSFGIDDYQVTTWCMVILEMVYDFVPH